MSTTPETLPPLPEKGYLGDDASYGYDESDMRDYALAALASKPAPVVPAGMVLVKAYSECGEFADDSPGARAYCAGKISRGATCELCPKRCATPAEPGQAQGVPVGASSACPICGVDRPHAHGLHDIVSWLRAQASRFVHDVDKELTIRIGTPEKWVQEARKRIAESDRDELARQQVCEAYAECCVPAPADQAQQAVSDATEQMLGRYAEREVEIKELLDAKAPDTEGNILQRVAQILEPARLVRAGQAVQPTDATHEELAERELFKAWAIEAGLMTAPDESGLCFKSDACRPAWAAWLMRSTLDAFRAAPGAEPVRPAKFFSYGIDSGFDLYDTATAAIEAAQTDIAQYRSDAMFDDEWSGDVEYVCWGVVLGSAVEVDAESPDDGAADRRVDYRLTNAAPQAEPQALPRDLVSPMDVAVLRLPFELGMDGAISQRQFFGRVQSLLDRIAALSRPAPEPFQQRVRPWLLHCFGAEIAGDKGERNHRFLEESLELVQACGCTKSEAHQLVDYVFGRPVGEPAQEVGGVMVTLAALCLAQALDMHAAGETELARIWPLADKIRAKQAAKPKHSPLPAHASPAPELVPLSEAEIGPLLQSAGIGFTQVEGVKGVVHWRTAGPIEVLQLFRAFERAHKIGAKTGGA